MINTKLSNNKRATEESGSGQITALSLLCTRFEFPTIIEMVSCLTEVDRTVAVIYCGMSVFIYISVEAFIWS
jgi:predicted metal-binding protein